MAFETSVALPLGAVAFEVDMTLLPGPVMEVAGMVSFGLMDLEEMEVDMTDFLGRVPLKVGMTKMIGLVA